LELLNAFTFLPLAGVALGALAGLSAGIRLPLRAALWLLSLGCVFALGLFFFMITSVPVDEIDALATFVILTRVVFPMLVAGVLGGVVGRVLSNRDGPR
jgi:hypothetical protein